MMFFPSAHQPTFSWFLMIIYWWEWLKHFGVGTIYSLSLTSFFFPSDILFSLFFFFLSHPHTEGRIDHSCQSPLQKDFEIRLRNSKSDWFQKGSLSCKCAQDTAAMWLCEKDVAAWRHCRQILHSYHIHPCACLLIHSLTHSIHSLHSFIHTFIQ